MPSSTGQNPQRVALVTGGAIRVGRAIVERLAADGFAVAFTYLTSQDEAESLASRIGGCAIRADLTDPEPAAAHVATALANFSPRLDLLVNSASIYQPSSLMKTDLQQMRRLMAIHYESPLLLARALAPKLRDAGGHVVNMVDLLAERPWPELLAYCASKAALVNLTLGLARELAPEVTVNGVAPGVVEWPDDYPQSERDTYLKRVPLHRAGTPEDVAALVRFLATEGAYITGQIIRLDGGRSVT
jgi:pteridine reductase